MNELTEVGMGEYTYNNYTIAITQSDDAPDPREWNEFTTMSCAHPNYKLGDEYIGGGHDISELYDTLQKDCIYLPLYLYDHSGLTMNTTGFSCPWDSGIVGFIWVSKDDVRKEYECERISERIKTLVEDRLRSDVEVYDQYLTRDVWDYTITFPDGEEDSCGGMYGYDYTKEHVIAEIDYLLETNHV